MSFREADLEKARGYIPKIAAFAGHLGESAQMLLAYAQMEEEIEVLASDLANYAMRRADEDVRVAKYQAMTGRLMSSFVELNAAGSFATPELMAIPDETFEGFFTACPELERYRRYLLDIRRRRAHVLQPGRGEAAGRRRRDGSGSGQYLWSPDGCRYDSSRTARMARATSIRCPTAPISPTWSPATARCARAPLRISITPTASFRQHHRPPCWPPRSSSCSSSREARKYGSAMEASLDVTNVPTSVYHEPHRGRSQESGQDVPLCRPAQKAPGRGRAAYVRRLYRPLVAGVSSRTFPIEERQEDRLRRAGPAGRGLPQGAAGGLRQPLDRRL